MPSPRTYSGRDLALTRYFAKLSISPESSDGFASVGTILPKEEATLLPGGLFAFLVQLSCDCGPKFPKRKLMKKIHFDPHFDLEDQSNNADAGSVWRKRHFMSHALHPVLQILIALSSLVLLIWPTLYVDEEDLDANDFDRTHIP